MEYSCQIMEKGSSSEFIACSNTADKVPCIYGQFAFCPPKIPEKEGDIKMAFTKDWRPDNWDQVKRNIVTETPIIFSPSTGYSKGQKDEIMERTATAILSALAEVIVK